MRATIVAGAVLAGCNGGGGGYELVPQRVSSECALFDCPVMAGSEVRARVVYFSDVEELVHPTGASISPPELGTVELDGDELVIRVAPPPTGSDPPQLAPGTGVIHVEDGDIGSFDRELTVAPRASTTIVPDSYLVPMHLFPERRVPGERLAVFDAQALILHAEHRDADGQLLLGHHSSVWSGIGVELKELLPMEEYRSDEDLALMRVMMIAALAEGSVTYSGATLPVESVPSGSTARVEIYELDVTTTALELIVQETTLIRVVPYAADGRFIFGTPSTGALAATSSDPTVVEVAAVSSTDRRVRVHGYRRGTATLSVSFDGRAVEIPVTVQ